MYKTEAFTPSRFTSEGTISLRGVEVPFHTVCEDNVFYDNDGKPVASIFSYSYFRSDVENPADRPVLFCFNGGPGSSSMMVHAGFLGAYRLKYQDDPDNVTGVPPYTVVENRQCMVDAADVVIIDPVGTGYGMLLDDSYAKKFYGMEEDAEALLGFVEMWLTRYNRWSSPKYLVGESYGCARAAIAAGMAQGGRGAERAYSMAFDGVVLIGNTVAPGKFFNVDLPVEPSVLGFPTYAAVNWYHNHPSGQTVEEFVAEAKAFADSEYLLALHKGDALRGDAREAVMEKVMYYTGVSREYLEENNLKIDEITVRGQFVRQSGRQVSRLDGRMTRPFYSLKTREPEWGKYDDAADNKYGPAFRSALCGSLFPRLNIKLDRAFVPTYSMNAQKLWNMEEKKGNTGEMLSAAMLRIPGMRAFFANGWYDICTQIGIAYYTIDHAGLPADRTFIKGYPSGHMVYLGEENIQSLTDDILKFIAGKDPTK